MRTIPGGYLPILSPDGQHFLYGNGLSNICRLSDGLTWQVCAILIALKKLFGKRR